MLRLRLITFPIIVTFWRRSNETRVRHRCPLFDTALGITLVTIAIDSLHCMNLGVCKEYCMHLIWELILVNAFGVEYHGLMELVELSCMVIKSLLLSWYGRNVDDSFTKVQDFSAAMIGRRNSRCLNTKAAETKGVLFFLVDYLQEHAANLVYRHDLWLGCGESLKGLLCVCASPKLKVDTSMYQDSIGKAV